MPGAPTTLTMLGRANRLHFVGCKAILNFATATSTARAYSLEVEQMGSGIPRQIRHSCPSHACVEFLALPSLINAICLAHDLGHPSASHVPDLQAFDREMLVCLARHERVLHHCVTDS
jgi:HD superfamily phosphohydrolase